MLIMNLDSLSKPVPRLCYVALEASFLNHWDRTEPSNYFIIRVSRPTYDYLLILDLEGQHEIIELPAILIALNRICEIGRFHYWIKPTLFRNDLQTDICHNPYSKAIPFTKALIIIIK